MTKYKATIELYFEADTDSWAEFKLEMLRRYCREATHDGPPLFDKMTAWFEEIGDE